MKRILLIMALAMMLPSVVFAQRGIPRSNNVSVSSTVVKRSFKEARTYNAKVGFQQMAGLNFGTYYFEDLALGLSYVGGYRFNDWLFTGVGAEYNFSITNLAYMTVPIYAHVRTYFTKRIWRPYVSLSAGCLFEHYPASAGYGDSDVRFYGDFSFGVDTRLTEKLNLFMAFGINNMGVLFKTGLSF